MWNAGLKGRGGAARDNFGRPAETHTARAYRLEGPDQAVSEGVLNNTHVVGAEDVYIDAGHPLLEKRAPAWREGVSLVRDERANDQQPFGRARQGIREFVLGARTVTF